MWVWVGVECVEIGLIQCCKDFLCVVGVEIQVEKFVVIYCVCVIVDYCGLDEFVGFFVCIGVYYGLIGSGCGQFFGLCYCGKGVVDLVLVVVVVYCEIVFDYCVDVCVCGQVVYQFGYEVLC